MISKILFWVFTVLVIPFIVWNLTMNLIIGGTLTILFIAGLMLYFRTNVSDSWKMVLFGVIFYIVTLPMTFNNITEISENYSNKIKHGEVLNPIEVWNIYGLHLIMGIVAYPIYPEASTEVLLMHIPHKTRDVIFEDDFFLRSDKLRSVLNTHNSGSFNWTMNDFYVTSKESRVSFALSPIYAFNVDKCNDTTKYQVAVAVKYNPSMVVKLIDYDGVKLVIYERMFHYLENIGLLHSYNAIWKATI